MQFAQPVWILAGAIICIAVAFLLFQLGRQKKYKLEQFAGTHLAGKLTKISPTHCGPSKRHC